MTESPKLLVVDDDPGVVTGIVSLLTRSGFVVDFSYNGADALCKIRDSGPYDLVVLDFTVKGLGAKGVIAEMRATIPDPPPVLIITGNYEAIVAPSELTKHVLTKPFDDCDLLRAVTDILKDGK